jgi:ABC-type bacteriocin/lantibiotic exporter with double-glycine peptidase domain
MPSLRNMNLEDSELTNKYSQEVARGQITLFNNLATALVNVIMMTLIFIAMIIINARIAFSLVVMILVIFLILFRLFRPIQRKLGDQIYYSSQEGSRLIRLLVGARKSFNYWRPLSFIPQFWFKSIFPWINNIVKSTFFAQQGKLVFEVVLYSVFPLFIYASNNFLFDSSKGLGDMIIFSALSIKLLPGINALSNSIQSIISNRNIIDTLINEEIIDRPKSQVKFSGNIEIKINKLSIEDVLLLKDSVININLGSKVAIIGRSGSGKSTLLRSILGMQEFQGEIRVGNEIIRDFSYLEPGCIQYLPQAPVFIPAKLIEICDDLAIDTEEYDELRKRLGLYHTKFDLDNMNFSNYDTEFSGGELQRLSILAALLQKPKLIILDEITAALDVKFQDSVMNLLKESPATIISITHRLESLKYYDKIFNIENEKITAYNL